MKYFKPEEFMCRCGCGDMKMDATFLSKLETAREIAGIQFCIVSGKRCPRHNKKVKGKPASAHLKGLAADIKARNSHARFLIVNALLDVGINRLVIYPTFVHADIDAIKPQEIIILG